MTAEKRKICYIITSKIHYARSKLILQELKNRQNVNLQIIVGASAILPNYGEVMDIMSKDGFTPNAKITMTLEGGTPVAMAKTTGIGITEFATAFENLTPDVVVVRGDRYEVLSSAVAAAYLNIPVAHIEGGDVTGTIDESVRHAVTKFSHIHFVTNSESMRRLLAMGEHPDYIFNVGCPELELAAKNNFIITNEFINWLGVGDPIDITKPYIILIQHPVTSEFGQNQANIEESLGALQEIGIQTIVFWPNIDAGTDEISKGIRMFRELKNPKNFRFIKHLSGEQFIGLLKNAACLVGNSSAGIKECSFLGVPAVNIGTRQNGRLRSQNVRDASYRKDEIMSVILSQLKHGKYEPSRIYFKENSSKTIADVLSSVKLYVQKKFHDPGLA